jgi:hypothetical protein
MAWYRNRLALLMWQVVGPAGREESVESIGRTPIRDLTPLRFSAPQLFLPHVVQKLEATRDYLEIFPRSREMYSRGNFMRYNF